MCDDISVQADVTGIPSILDSGSRAFWDLVHTIRTNESSRNPNPARMLQSDLTGVGLCVS